MKNLYKALLEAQKELSNIKKDSENPYYHSSYASLEACLDGTKEVLAKHGLIIHPFPDVLNGQQVLINRLVHVESGESTQSMYLIKPAKEDPQSYGSALSYARRYSLLTVLNLAQEDDDGARASQTHQAPKAAQSQRVPSQNTVHSDGITEKQQKRLFAIARECGWSKEDVRNYLGKLGLEHTEDLTWMQYESMVKMIQTLPRDAESQERMQ